MTTNKAVEVLQEQIEYNEKLKEDSKQWAERSKEKFKRCIEQIGKLEAENEDLKEAIKKLKGK